MARRPAPKDNTEALLGLPVRGRHERAMETTIREWACGGEGDRRVDVDVVAFAGRRGGSWRSRSGDYWHIGNANRVLMELRAQYIDLNVAGFVRCFHGGDDSDDMFRSLAGQPHLEETLVESR
jgi:hypothetical protein